MHKFATWVADIYLRDPYLCAKSKQRACHSGY
jgi:hypothetical protein